MATNVKIHEEGIREVRAKLMTFRDNVARQVADIARNETIPVITGRLRNSVKVYIEPKQARVTMGEPEAPRPAPSNYALWVEIGTRFMTARAPLRRALVMAAGRLGLVPL